MIEWLATPEAEVIGRIAMLVFMVTLLGITTYLLMTNGDNDHDDEL